MRTTLNRYFLSRATIVYFTSLLACCILYSNHWMEWYWILAGIIEVTLFFGLSTHWEIGWSKLTSAQFEKKIFWGTAAISLLWVISYYLFTTSVWGTPWEQPIGTSMDSTGYFDEAMWLNEMILNKDIKPYLLYVSGHIDDAGYPIYLGLLSLLTRDGIFVTRLPNVIFDAWTVVLTYRIANRNFGEKVARLAGLFTMLMPMILFYSGVTMKESLMLMIAMWALERGDLVIRSKLFMGFNFPAFIILTLLLLLFRTALAWVIMLSFVCALVLSSERIISKSRRIGIITMIAVAGLFFMGGRILDQGNELIEKAESTGANFEYRAARRGGNALVRNLNKAVLAPIIFTVPFPTMVTIEGQNIQQLQNGGFYLKNILSFFVLFSLFILLKRKAWSDNVMIIAYMIGYLIALSLSSFAHSGRFHHPVLPVEMIFAALGIYSISSHKQAVLFDYFLLLEFLIIIAWNGFKLKGRGAL